MGESKHTPWAVDEDGDVVGADGTYVCLVLAGETNQESAPYAHLIAAAPDMLEAWNSAPVDADYPNAEAFRKAVNQWLSGPVAAAIAKAEGRTLPASPTSAEGV